MTRERRFRSRSDESDESPNRRRAVLDDARRRVERALALVDAAEELATAAEAVLRAAEAEHDADRKDLAELRTALNRYRKMHAS